MSELDSFRYPIGKFVPQEVYEQEAWNTFLSTIETLPARLAEAVDGFSESKFETPYRDGGWTVKQVIHHLTDSHMNAYIRFKWTLTEETPTIKAYNEKLWAETIENKAPASISIDLLRTLHVKWLALIKNLTPSDFQKIFIHPETNKEIKLQRMVALYAWHCEHHLAHITSLKKRMNW